MYFYDLILNCVLVFCKQYATPGEYWYTNNFWGPFQQHSRSDIAHLRMRIIEIKRAGQSARILPIHGKEGVKRRKSTSFLHFRKRQELGHEKSGK